MRLEFGGDDQRRHDHVEVIGEDRRHEVAVHGRHGLQGAGPASWRWPCRGRRRNPGTLPFLGNSSGGKAASDPASSVPALIICGVVIVADLVTAAMALLAMEAASVPGDVVTWSTRAGRRSGARVDERASGRHQDERQDEGEERPGQISLQMSHFPVRAEISGELNHAWELSVRNGAASGLTAGRRGLVGILPHSMTPAARNQRENIPSA